MSKNRSGFIVALLAVAASASCGGKDTLETVTSVAGSSAVGAAGGGGAGLGSAAGGSTANGAAGSHHAGTGSIVAGGAFSVGGNFGVAGGAARGGAAGAGGGAHGGAGAGGAGGAPGAPLGANCVVDAQCRAGMVCLTAAGKGLNGSGPAGGLCTLKCASTADCSAVEKGSDCFNFGTDAAPKLYCLEGCVQGGDESTAAGKCQGRADFACVDLSSSPVADPYCVPLCRSDNECSPGDHCSNATGLCSSAQPSGDPVGTPCTPSTASGAGSNNCQGVCIRTTADGVTPSKGVCAEYCAGLVECGYHDGQPGGVCFGQLSDTFGYLDLGYCLPACNCTADCPFPGDKCRAWTTDQQTFVRALGAPGLCAPELTGSVELTACAEGGAAGSSN